MENCLLPDDKLRFTPSMSSGLDTDTETDLRVVGCELIQAAGILLRLPQVRARPRASGRGNRRARSGGGRRALCWRRSRAWRRPPAPPRPRRGPGLRADPGPASQRCRPSGAMREARQRGAKSLRGLGTRLSACSRVRRPKPGDGAANALGRGFRSEGNSSLFQVAMATGQVLFQRFFYTKSFVKHSMEVSALPRVFPAEIHRGKTWAAVGGLLRGARTCLLAGVLYVRGWGAPGPRAACRKRPLQGGAPARCSAALSRRRRVSVEGTHLCVRRSPSSTCRWLVFTWPPR